MQRRLSIRLFRSSGVYPGGPICTEQNQAMLLHELLRILAQISAIFFKILHEKFIKLRRSVLGPPDAIGS